MTSNKSLKKLVTEALGKLDSALSEAFELSQEVDKELYNINKLFESIVLLREFLDPIFEKHPELKPDPPWQNESEPSLTHEEAEIVSQLNQEVLNKIDNELLSYVNESFQKVSKIVASFMASPNVHSSEIPLLLYVQRIEEMSKKGLLESQGNLKFMRYSEVRVPKNNPRSSGTR